MDFWTGEKLTAGQSIEAAAGLDTMPLYVAGGSILTMGPMLQWAEEKPQDPIELRVYSGRDGKCVLYNDAGEGMGYEKGEHITIPISWDEQKRVLTIGERQGKFAGMIKKRTFKVVLVKPGHGVGVAETIQPDKVVSYDGRPIDVSL